MLGISGPIAQPIQCLSQSVYIQGVDDKAVLFLHDHSRAPQFVLVTIGKPQAIASNAAFGQGS